MPTYPLAFPSIGIRQSSLRPMNVVSQTRSIFTGATQKYKHPGEWFEGEISLRPMTYTEAAAVKSFLAELSGGFGNFLYGDPDNLAKGNLGTPTAVGATTNHIRNGQLSGSTNGIIGSGGVPPTNCNVSFANGLTTEIIGSGTDGDRTYVDVKISGTAAASSSYNLSLESSTQIVAVQGETWTASFYMKMLAGSLSGINFINARISEATAAGSTLFTTEGADIKASLNALTWVRTSATRTMTDPTCGRTRPSYRMSVNNGAAIDITIRISSPQHEQQAAATPYVTTSGAAASRPAGITVKGASQTGNSLVVWGFGESLSNRLKAGDYIQLGSGSSSRLHMITQDTASDFTGKATLSLWPALRSSPADAAALTVSGAKGVFELTADPQWDSDMNCVTSVTLPIREVLTV
jgi:hypothetical protein